jgi:beta-glucosidase
MAVVLWLSSSQLYGAEKEITMTIDQRVADLLERLTTEEKIGQMSQVNAAGGKVTDDLAQSIRDGRIGSVLNEVDVATVNELQRIAVEQSRLGIPLLIGRDVIHGFKTIFPIPLGQAASFNPELVKAGARVAALEAASAGINWTFAPMIDVTRDPRWGRIAESLGEDPYVTSVLGAAMVAGFQGTDLAAKGTIAACAKHFAGYGASESGRDYNTTNIPENELRNVYLPPFKAAVDAGVATLMASFSDLDGIPASANTFLMRQILREEWGFDGFVVSDWASIEQLSVHGLTANNKEAAEQAIAAGINMEMASTAYMDHLAELLNEGRVELRQIDEMAAAILKVKFELGLFENPYTDPSALPAIASPEHLALAKESALQSAVLLQNRDRVLPLDRETLSSLAVVGPLADDPYEQLGTWIFDGDPQYSQTPLTAIRALAGEGVTIRHVRAMETTRSRTEESFEAARSAALASDAVVVFLGEESILSGEAHSRADISLPGNQADLVRVLHETGQPVIAVIMAGRPLTLANILEQADAILFAWHPGSMGGPAIADLLFGVESPSGKLPATFPRMVGQVPIYYAHKRTGKPANAKRFKHIDDIPVGMPQTSSGFVSSHLDAGFTPQFPFGFGLSYADFTYSDIGVSQARVALGEPFSISAKLTNQGAIEAEEVVQLYIRDLVGSVTRPVRELKGFKRIRLAPGESRTVSFELTAKDLAFYDRNMRLTTEPGEFHAWIGGSSQAQLQTRFTLVSP